MTDERKNKKELILELNKINNIKGIIGPVINKTPLKFLMKASLCILLAEGVIMIIFQFIPSLPGWAIVVIDSVLIAVISLPLLYKWLFKPMVKEITERKQADEMLKVSEKKYRSLIEGTDNLVTKVDPQGRFTFVNQSSEKMFGLAPEKCIGLSAFDFIHPDDRESTKQSFKVWLRDKPDSITYENRQVSRTGEVRDTIWTSNFVYNKDGTLNSINGIARDITDRKRAEEALKTEKHKLQSIIDAMPSGLTIRDLEYNLLYQSKLTLDIFGDQTGKKCYKVFENLDEKCEDCPVELAYKDGKSHTIIKNITLPSGEITCFENIANLIRNAKGEIVACLEISTDITERKLADEAVKESERKLAFHLQNTPIAAIEWNLDFEVMEWNDAAEKIFGFTKEEAMGKHAAGLIVPESAREHVDKVWGGLLKNKGGFHSTNENNTKDGRTIVCEWNNTPLLDQNGKVYGVASLVQDITQRQQTEKALQESERKYKHLFESMIDGFALHEIIYDDSGKPIDYRFLTINPAFERLTGLKAADMIGKRAYEALPGLESIWLEKYGNVALTGESIHFENYSDALKKHFEVSAYRPAPGQFACIFVDITARKQAEEALKNSEEKYRNLAETSQDLIWKCDAEGRFTYLNPAWENTNGYALEEMLGRPFTDFQTPEVAAHDTKEFGRYLAGGSVKGYETTQISKSGDTIHLVFNAIPLFDSEGNIIGTQGTAYDITERKRAEEALRKSEQRFWTLVESAPMAVYETDAQGKCLYVNEKWRELAGLSLEDALGDGWQEALYKEDRDRIIQLWSEYSQHQEPWDMEYRFCTPGGKISWVLGRAIALRDTDGRVTGYLGANVDITERKKAEDRARLLLDNLPCVAMILKKGAREIVASNNAARAVGAIPGATCYETCAQRQESCTFCRAPEMWEANEIKDIEVEYEGVWYHGIWVPLTDDLYVHYIFDITDRKRAEEKLKESEKKSRAWLDNSPTCTKIVDLDFNLQFMSAGGIRDLKIDDITQFYGKPYPFHFYPDSFKNLMAKNLEKVKKTGEVITQEASVVDIEGNELWYHSTLVPVNDDEGRIEYIIIVSVETTERKRAEKALQESEEKYRLIFETAASLITSVDSNGTLVDCNMRIEGLLGYKRDELIGQNMGKIIHPEYHQKAQESLAEIISTGFAQNKEYKMVRKDGKNIDVRINSSSIKDEHGNFVRSICIIENVTDHKRAEEALRESENSLKEAQNIANMGSWNWDLLTNEIVWSDNLCRLHKLKPGTFDGRFETVMSLIHPDDLEGVQKKVQKMLDEKKPIEFEYRIVTIEGTVKNVRGRQKMYFDNEGNLIKLMGTIQDITERKRAEEEIKNLAKFPSENPNPILRIDSDGILLYGNEAAFIVFLAWELRVGKSIPEELQALTKFAEGIHIRKEEVVCRKRFFSMVAAFYPDAGYVNIYATDITETKRLLELESRAARLETAGTIAGQVAHDFNNLLGPLVAYPEIIKEELPADHPIIPMLNNMEKAAEQMAEINQQLLTLGRRGHYTQETLDINEVINEALNQIEPKPKSLFIDTELNPDLLNIKGGYSQLLRAISNILMNSMDAMENNGHILIRTENYYADDTSIKYDRVPKGEYIKITITDTGCGISDDVISKIFDPFVTTKTANKKRGSGLGLSVVDAVIKDHNGFIDINTTIGRGTSFYLYFPITRETIDANNSGIISGGSEKILVVDDDEMQREVTLILLKKLGYKTNAVESGESALLYLKDNPQDLLILDMIMPGGIDGAETYLKALDINPEQKAIIVSGFAETNRVEAAMNLGAGAFIRKPLTLESVSAVIRKELDKVLV